MEKFEREMKDGKSKNFKGKWKKFFGEKKRLKKR